MSSIAFSSNAQNLDREPCLFDSKHQKMLDTDPSYKASIELSDRL